MMKDQQNVHGFVSVTFWFNHDMTDEEVMSFVDQLAADNPNVCEHEYDHVFLHPSIHP